MTRTTAFIHDGVQDQPAEAAGIGTGLSSFEPMPGIRSHQI
jgi:hypothetical protein